MNGNDLVVLLIVLGVILVSMILHELAHGLVAYWLGDDTAKQQGRLTLNPFKHLDPILSFAMPIFLLAAGMPIFGGAKPVPINTRNLRFGAWGMALVGVAGPLMNFILAFGAFMVGYFTGWLASADLIGVVIWEFITINLGFGIFNLIPIPPLDGSRVLYAIAPDVIRSGMEKMERFGILVVMVIVVVFPGVIAAIMNGAIVGMLNLFYLLVS